MTDCLLWAGAVYAAASVNFAILVLAILGKGDPRGRFSGNAGTTNVYRMAGPFWAAAVLLLDVGRAVAAAILGMMFLPPEQVPWLGLALVAGNRFPCFHGFRGGKGVAAYLGFAGALAPWAAVLAAALWVFVFSVARVPFVASFFMIAALAAGEGLAAGGSAGTAVAVTATVLLILAGHRRNLREVRGGQKAEASAIESETGKTGPEAG
ncbi:MAG: glycerol-3-phosphate acyltransferase [Syntrophaceae bacterium]|nr:glycerol-3-phosphate acyltransferase [Syntrophaceae bacterium]